MFVGMTGEGVERGDARADRMGFAEDVDRVLAGKNLRAQRVFGAVADEQNEIGHVADMVFQMMPDAAGFTHARSADNDGRFHEVVQFHRVRQFANVSEILHAERIFLFAQEPAGAVVEAFRMEAIDLRGVHAERAVHEDGHLGKRAFTSELVKRVNDLLSAADGKRRDDHLSHFVNRITHEPADFLFSAVFRGMFTVAVGAFDLEVVHVLNRLRVAQDVVLATADVAAEKKPVFAAGLANVEDDLSGAEDVTGVPERDRHTVDHREGAVVVEGYELAHGLFGVPGSVEWFDWRQACPGASFGDILRVGALNFGGVLQHDGGKVPSGERAVNIAEVALVAKVWQIPAMVDMRVAEHDGVEPFRVERKVSVPLDGFAAFALEQTALEQKPSPVEFEQKHGAGRRAG